MAHDELHQAALDGTLSDEEFSQFNKSLDADPKSGLRFEALKRVDRSLRQLPSSDPPPELREGVMRQIRLRQAIWPAPMVRGGFSAWWKGWFSTRPGFQVGLGFALGILVLLPLMRMAPPLSVDPAAVTGTLANRDRLPGKAARKLDISGPGLSGALIATTEGEVLVLQIHLSSVEPIEAALHFEAPLGGLYSISSDSPAASDVRYSNQELTLHHVGTASYTIKLATSSGASRRMDLGILRSGEPVFEAAVP